MRSWRVIAFPLAATLLACAAGVSWLLVISFRAPSVWLALLGVGAAFGAVMACAAGVAWVLRRWIEGKGS